jgi:biopolymer transport protein ExbD
VKVSTGFEGKKPRIEMIALIDVVFLLLVFFIYAMLSMTVQRGVEVRLPRIEGTKQKQSLIITLDSRNRFYLGERPVGLEELKSLLAAEDSALPVLIRGDAGADLGVALGLLEALRDMGRDAVSFQVSGVGQ